MNTGLYPKPLKDPGPPDKKIIKAREFLAAFRKRPDDFHLMEKFAIKPKRLKKVYSELIARGWLSEYEYSHREKKAPDLEDRNRPPLPESMAAGLIEDPSETMTEHVLKSGYFMETDFTKALLKAVEDKKRQINGGYRPEIDAEKTPELCPRCGKPKHTSSPNECIYCGVVFAKVRSN